MREASTPVFQRAAIIGLGLMGGSLGLGLRATSAVATIAGHDATEGVAAAAKRAGAVDEAAPSIPACLAGADLVILATPVLAMRAVLVEAAPALGPAAVITDLGSTKIAVMEWAETTLPHAARFIGGHPMAGSEKSGISAARANLFHDAVWCLTPSPRTDARALERLRVLIQRLGARPLLMDAARHDAAVARVSHVPLLAATALVLAASADADWDFAGTLAAGGFRDSTRVASGSAVMARDICLTNTAAILRALDDYIAELRALRDGIAARDGAIEQRFAQARATRAAWQMARSGEP